FRSRITVEKRETSANGSLFVTFPGLPNRISLTVLMKALGLNDDEILGLFDDEAKLEVLMNVELKGYLDSGPCPDSLTTGRPILIFPNSRV
ncbi:hypothetical protein ACFLRC_03030, partial [Candidatus Altiarchaeota archaeon]